MWHVIVTNKNSTTNDLIVQPFVRQKEGGVAPLGGVITVLHGASPKTIGSSVKEAIDLIRQRAVSLVGYSPVPVISASVMLGEEYVRLYDSMHIDFLDDDFAGDGFAKSAGYYFQAGRKSKDLTGYEYLAEDMVEHLPRVATTEEIGGAVLQTFTYIGNGYKKVAQ